MTGGSAAFASVPAALVRFLNTDTAFFPADFNPPELSDSDKASTASCAGFFNSAGRRLASPPAIDSATSAAAVRSLPLFPDTPEMKDSMKSTAVSTISGAWDAASTAKSAKMFPASFTAAFRPPFLKASVISLTACVACTAVFFSGVSRDS